ncbi:ABC transporter permease [Amnibacterium endophyticum]|uniref:ABC transporter permease n=1 Tax=Amnibacterium endophyticum TaxID=2109337 RepID=A0ABW4L931_9MICO
MTTSTLPRTAPVVSASTANAIRYTARRTAVTVGTILVSALVLAALWQIAVLLPGQTAFIAKGPLDVVAYFTQDSITGTAADHRALLAGLLGVTLTDAALGFAVGLTLSVAISIAFTMFRTVEFMFMPIAMLLRTVPLLAMAPVIYIVFGNGRVTAALIGTVVVLFPVLVNLTVGLRSVSQQSVDLITVYGGSRVTTLLKVAIPTALPHLFASMRIAVPGAITGAMLYEYLFTTTGLGAAVTSAKAAFDYNQLWAATVLATAVSIVLYTITTIVEAAVLSEWGPDAGKAAGS